MLLSEGEMTMRDLTTKALLFLIFLALVFNAFVTLVRPSRAADGQAGRYAIVSYYYGEYSPTGKWHDDHGYYKMDTITGEVESGR